MLRLRLLPADEEVDFEACGGVMTIGRAPNAELTIDDPHVSALHGQIALRAGRYCYQDLGSTNGSAIERHGRRIVLSGSESAPVELREGDRVLLGSDVGPAQLQVLVCRVDERPTAPATIVTESRMVPTSELLGRLEASGRTLAPYLQLADELAGAETPEQAFAAFERCVAESATTVEPGGVFESDPASDTPLRFAGHSGDERPLPKVSTSTPADALSLVRVAELEHPAVLVPLRVSPDQILFAIGYARCGQPSQADLDGLSLAASQLLQRLGQLRLVAELTAARTQLMAKNRYLRERAQRRASQSLVGQSPVMRALLKDIQAVSLSEATVLISGPSGAGKELVAREIHHRSLRHAEIFAAVNCGALAEGVLESELFGHKRGAFTGAHRDREGLFEVTHGGTLLLDEIGEMSPGLQVKLLRVLETGEVTPVGGTRSRRVDVRVLCATHRELGAEVAAGRFREDLFYRIHVFPIRVPPLSERQADIPLLVRHLIKKQAEANGLPVPQIDTEAMRALVDREYPGNVRQLANEVHRALLLAAEAGRIERRHLSWLDDEPAAQAARACGRGTLKEQLTRVERTLVEQSLARNQGNRTHAAREMGITRQALLAKLKKLRIE